MSKSIFLVIVTLLLLTLAPLRAQMIAQTHFLSNSLSQTGESAPPVSFNDPTLPPAGKNRSISWKKLIPNTLEDQKTIYWEFPRSLARGQFWLPTSVFLAATGALIAVDQYDSPYFRRTSTYHGFNSGFSGTNTSLMIAAVPAATYLAGLAKKSSYAKATTLWTAEAVGDSEIAAGLLKVATRRARPENIQPGHNFGDTWFDSPGIASGGFPSGHTIAAFSVAAVMSRRYGHDHRWVPYVAYGLASTIGFSRITLSAHNVSEVFVGAALGYAISRFVVLGHDRSEWHGFISP
jgi:membrane-associated phospholipid phosphatase